LATDLRRDLDEDEVKSDDELRPEAVDTWVGGAGSSFNARVFGVEVLLFFASAACFLVCVISSPSESSEELEDSE
jgi:hypothetical protein